MSIWIALAISLFLAVGFHYLDAHRERPDFKRIERLYVGSPGYVALCCDSIAITCVVLIVLRWFGVDIPALWSP